jgi:hypothetical protein
MVFVHSEIARRKLIPSAIPPYSQNNAIPSLTSKQSRLKNGEAENQ